MTLPEPTFEFLVATLGMQAQMHMGLFVPDPAQTPEVNLPLARHMIDMVAMIQIKTKNNLSLEESRMLENSLTELRFRYVQATEHAGKAQAGTADVEAIGTPAEASAVESQAEPQV